MMTGDLDVCLRGGHVVAIMRGELDVTNSADAMSVVAALAARHRLVIVELSALEFMDCGALGALLRVQQLARRSGGDVLLAAPAAGVRRLLSLTIMGEMFSVHATVDAAVATIGQSRESGSGAGRAAELTGCSAAGPAALSGSPW